MTKRRLPVTTLYHLLAAYADVLHRQVEREREQPRLPTLRR